MDGGGNMLLPMPKVVLLGVDAILPNIPKDKLLLKLLIEAGGVCWRGMQPCHFAEAIAVQRLQLHTPHRGCTRRKSFGPHSQPQRAFAVHQICERHLMLRNLHASTNARTVHVPAGRQPG